MGECFPPGSASNFAASGLIANNAGGAIIDPACVAKRIILVAPTLLFRDGLAEILQRQDRRIIGSCETLIEAISALAEMDPPDLFIVQSEAGQDDSLFAQVQERKADFPNSYWLVLSRQMDSKFLKSAVAVGIDACLSTASSADVLRLQVELVLLGHSFVKTELTQVLVQLDRGGKHTTVTSPIGTCAPPPFVALQTSHMLDADTGPRKEDGQAPVKRPRPHDTMLSVRELEILKQLVEGQPNKTIARNLDIAEATVKVHVKALFRKMHVANRTQAAISATQYLQQPDADAWAISVKHGHALR
jgi:two-component system nitrate/nitrite response regulator NarL